MMNRAAPLLIATVALAALLGCDEGGGAVPASDVAADHDTAPTPPQPGAIVVINEVLVRAVDDSPDWVEFLNPGTVPYDLSGYQLTDDNDSRSNTWEFPAGTILPPGEFLVVFGKGATGPLAFDFGFSSEEHAALLNPDGGVVDLAWWQPGEVCSGCTFGRYPDGVGTFRVLGNPTPGAPNDPTPPPEEPLAPGPPSPVLINEVLARPLDDDISFVELIHVGDDPVDLQGWALTDDPFRPDRFVFPATLVVQPGEFVVVEGRGSPDPVFFDFNLGREEVLSLVYPDGTLADRTAWRDGELRRGWSWARWPVDGQSDFVAKEHPTPGRSNAP